MPAAATLVVRGVEVPRLGLGTYRLTGDTCRKAVSAALELGYRHIDTAEMYENEEEVGAGMRDAGVARSEIFLATKVWRDHLRPRDLDRAVDGSLARLGTDYVDLLLVHWPSPDVPLEETMTALAAVRDDGRTRLIGVSNFPAGLLVAALELAPGLACDQVEYHPLLGQNRLLAVVREHDMFLTAYSPIARNRIAGEQILQEVAATHAASIAQVSLAWLLSQDRVVAIPKATSRDHLAENRAAMDLELSPAELGAIDLLPKDRRIVDPGWVDFENRDGSLGGVTQRAARAAWHRARRLLRGGG
jgi:2,5-diketo-D-gluconate reductase B